ncbi:MAG: chemotaxis response regulator protein-glutamate methylesterase [bacterium]
MNRVRVLVVDDSAVVRQVFSRELARDPDVEVIGAAPDPYVARDLIVRERPDVVVLDVEMPRMDGLTFLRKLMRHHPLPVVVVSSLNREGGDLAMAALEAGAVDVMCKPGAAYTTGEMTEELRRKVKAAAQAVTRRREIPGARERALPELTTFTDRILAIGASTGGTTAIETLLSGLPANCPGTVITQHMPQAFTAAFASRLNERVAPEVREARAGDAIVPGVVLIAPGGRHLLVRRSGARFRAEINDGPPINYHRPSVDALFHSVANAAGRSAVGVILTGMGNDGAAGLRAMRDAGAFTLAQDEASCVVFGMPMEAIRLGAADRVESIGNMARAVVESLRAVTAG